jgi:plastocyanin
MTSSRLAIALVVTVALAAPTAAGAATKTVTMGPTPKQGRVLQQQLSSDANQFFRSTVTIRAGDAVRFVPFGFHNVDFPRRGGDPLPLVAPGAPTSGQVDAAGAPFWFNGQPGIGFNPALARSNFGKTLRYTGARAINSGLPLEARPKPMTVRFPRTGNFTYFCDVHPGMKGKVRVKRRGASIPSKRADQRAVAQQVAKAVAAARRLRQTDAPDNSVFLGVADRSGVEFFGMVPETLTVPIGTTVDFRMSRPSFEVHTGTFGPGDPIEEPNSYLGELAASFQSPAFAPIATFPSEPPGTTASFRSTLHGNGFWNTGLLDAVPSPLPASAQVTFGQAGSFTFLCLVHPFMKGTVIVQ